MDTAFETILSYQFLLFCLAISALTYVIRLIVEYCFSVKNIVPKDNHAWNELILPILPIVLGCVGALLAKKYPFPDQITSYSGRAVFGLVAGSFSTIVWRWTKAFFINKIAIISGQNKSEDKTEDNGASAGKIEGSDK